MAKKIREITPFDMIEIDHFVDYVVDKLKKREREAGREMYSPSTAIAYLINLKYSYEKEHLREIDNQ